MSSVSSAADAVDPPPYDSERHSPSTAGNSLAESHRSIAVPTTGGFWRKMIAFSGPGFLVAVGYMDPGNWATDLAGGSKFGYTLLSVIVISNFMAILLQHLCARLGIAAGLDLAQACRVSCPPVVNYGLWFLCELAIIACDVAEVIGTAIALQLLFHVSLPTGVLITAVDVFLILLLQRYGFRYLEAFIIAMIAVIAGCFAINIFAAQPSLSGIASGILPSTQILTNPAMLVIAIGILGATVMPHNLYLHSSIVQTRAHGRDDASKKEAIKFATIDSTFALMFALFINGAILVLAAAAFHGGEPVEEIQHAYKLLENPSWGIGAGVASTLFAVALLCSGQNSTITGTLAGQIVMEGFLQMKMKPWLRRVITRGLAILPAAYVAFKYGESGTTQLLILSQVVLSLQLPFAVIPLILFCSQRSKMGVHRPANWILGSAWVVASIIVVLNIKLLFDFITGLFGQSAA